MALAAARSHAAPAAQAAALLAVVLALPGCRKDASAASLWRTPEEAVRHAALAAAEGGLPVEIEGLGTLRLLPVRLSELVVSVDGPRARLLFRAEGEGRIAGRHVGYIGGEAATLLHGASGWTPDAAGWLPRLRGVLEALVRREAALRSGEGPALAALAVDGYRDGWLDRKALAQMAHLPGRMGELPPVRAWLIRIEGARATVSEIVEPRAIDGTEEDGSAGRRAKAAGPERSIEPRQETRRLELEEAAAGPEHSRMGSTTGWRFSGGLL